MGSDGRVTSFDVIDQIQNSLTVNLPPDWLTTVCALPQLGALLDDARQQPKPEADELEHITQALHRSGGHTVLGVLMACRDADVDFGMLLINAIADGLQKAKERD